MQHIISSILPIFLIAILGKIIKIHWLKSKEFWKGLESLCYYLLFPIVLFNNISSADVGAFHLIHLVMGLVISSIILSAALIALQRHYKIDGKLFTSIYQGSVRYNSYIFFAMGDALFGNEGMVIVSVIAAYMIIFTNILTVTVFSIYAPQSDDIAIKRGDSQVTRALKKLFTNPLIISSILGFLSNHLEIDMSDSIHKTFSMMSESAFGVGMLYVGSGLRFNMMNINKFALFSTLLFKLILFPAITFIILKIIGVSGLALTIGVLYSSLPTSTNSYLLSKKLGGDSDSMASILTATIALSVLSLSLIMYIFK